MAGPLKFLLSFVSTWGKPPETTWLIPGYAPIGAKIVKYALPKKFKTFGALSWACCVASGHDWCGIPVKKGRVLYIALESFQGGVKRRLEAWCNAHGIDKKDFADNFAFLPIAIDFSAKGSVEAAFREITQDQRFKPDLIVIDTWFKSVGSASVSDQAQMSSALEQLDWFQKAVAAVEGFADALDGVTVVIIAHTPKDGSGLFGSIVQGATIDLFYTYHREGIERAVTLQCTDARDIEEPPSLKLFLDLIPIETEGGPEKSLAVTRATLANAADFNKPSDKTRPNLDQAWDILFAAEPRGLRWTDWYRALKAAGISVSTNFTKELSDTKPPRIWKDGDRWRVVIPGLGRLWLRWVGLIPALSLLSLSTLGV